MAVAAAMDARVNPAMVDARKRFLRLLIVFIPSDVHVPSVMYAAPVAVCARID
jgi:hypothetical protein